MFVLLYLGCTNGQTLLYLWPNVSSDTICREKNLNLTVCSVSNILGKKC